MRRELGFTLVEVIVFLIITSLMMSTFLIGANASLRSSPTVHNQWVALQVARQCMEYFVGESRINGYASITCPSTPSPTACTAPTGFTVSTDIACTTWNTDANYKTITVTVGGRASTSLSLQIGNY